MDGELKRLNGTGKYVYKKKADIIIAEMEGILWKNGLLGDHSPQVLVNTLAYLIGLSDTAILVSRSILKPLFTILNSSRYLQISRS